ncbi:hypothetical protein HMPREF1548_05400, partial [Clostridium sp. KLE 1755]
MKKTSTANTSWSWNVSEIHSSIYTPAQFFFPSYLPFSLSLLPCPFSPSQPTRPAEANCPGGGGAGRFAQGAGCEGDSRMLTKFWSCFLKPPTDALPAIRQL